MTKLPRGQRAATECQNTPACKQEADWCVDCVQQLLIREREKCAKIAEEMAIPGHNVQGPTCAEIAKRIRALLP